MIGSVRSSTTLALLIVCALVLPPGRGWVARTEAPLVLEATIPLPDVAGRIDHMAVDAKRKRLIVAELGNNTVNVVDLAMGKVVHRVTGLPEPQGVGYAERADLVAVANAGDGSVRLFRTRPLPSVETAPGARTSLFVPDLDRLFVARRAGARGAAAVLVYRPLP